MANDLSSPTDALVAAAALAEPRVLVTVAQVAGSAPREAGAKMLVTRAGAYDTIGGGHLEMRATDIAREMLAMPAGSLAAQRRLERFPLGPSLGQCCGGVVHLAFERVMPEADAHFATLVRRKGEGRDSWRLLPLGSTEAASMYDAAGLRLSGNGPALLPLPGSGHGAECTLRLDDEGRQWLVDACLPYRPRLYLFGAGHVGAAIVRALAELPCQVVWIDEREDMFPSALPANTRIEATDTPEAVIEEAPAGASFLVLTHSHALDQQLSEHILRRTDFTWFGLIGSATKRVQFERRLCERGIPAERMAEMTCPIGLPGIRDKAPAVIAVSVAAQLMQVWEAAAHAQAHVLPADTNTAPASKPTQDNPCIA
ncbi:xanthine dehydrogenase accessory protein XdhC [Duganella sp. LX20W]|uniref:Xanthine dehydrogenase accessory protein XdhC n=1 Tax=Rugamonas brunnea TaxID=2758569 RepID=A0A7W2ETL7_9BURK|nr:xanthine dehydrogenase accessory protein XdhC [Rugamonas brunnea]MBA5638344.1 xanthine dehydrogenase accessory protein XdhC [Rugamonas brunnea]